MPNIQNKTKEECLNGWWDFKPVYSNTENENVPDEGWLKGAYLVPSFWNKPFVAMRKKGDTYYRKIQDINFDESAIDSYEFLYDEFGYPNQWSLAKAAWIRRKLDIGSLTAGRRYFLSFRAVSARYRLFVNGNPVASHNDSTLPFDVDVTDFIREGENTVAIFVTDYDRAPDGRTKTPSGNMLLRDRLGIWQDVYLTEKSEVYLSDITVRTSVRDKTIGITFEITNLSDNDRNITICPDIVHWRKNQDDNAGEKALDLPQMELTIRSKGRSTAQIIAGWENAELWYPENPKLYQVRTALKEREKILEVSFERFGFREVWIDGPDIMLNDYPVHMFSDWGQKVSVFNFTEAWVRKWYDMIRDANMNHSRLFGYPHPKMYLDIADEEGILITGETAIIGCGGMLDTDSPEFWEAAAEHIKNFVRRDKNHPCLILWSVGNEMRWNGGDPLVIRRKMPELYKLFREVDPTRPAYFEGDTSLWDERMEDISIISRHYGRECAGIGWWDGKKPLHCGEMADYHHSGPHNTLHLGGDGVWASFKLMDEMTALDAAYIIESGRTVGVCCLGPWNISCNENLRMSRETVKLEYGDYTVPGMKPLFVKPYSSEFNFWEEGKGYTPNYSFDIQKHAFRPFAIIDRSLRTAYFKGSNFKRELFIVNDTSETVEGTLEVSLKKKDRMIWQDGYDIFIKRGNIQTTVVEAAIPERVESGEYEYSAVFKSKDQILDSFSRNVKICGSILKEYPEGAFIKKRMAVFGPGLMKKYLEALKVDYFYVDSIEQKSISDAGILLLEKNTAPACYSRISVIRDFVRNGGRLVVMEQNESLFPGMELEDKSVIKAFKRCYDHEVINGFDEQDFFAWGDDPYVLASGDSYVANRMYKKNDARNTLFLMDGGEGEFGSGNLDYTPLFEAAEGDGLILACQLRLTEKMGNIPAAERILLNLIKRADSYVNKDVKPPVTVDGNETEALDRYVKAAEDGAAVIVESANEAAIAEWSKALGIRLEAKNAGDVYQAVRAIDDPILNGVSNEDICGIETFLYVPKSAENNIIAKNLLAYSPELTPILKTPDENCLKELMVYKGYSEPLRAHTISRFLFDGKPDKALVMAQVKVGKGRIIFNQFSPPTDRRIRFNRLKNRLMANLGFKPSGSLFDETKPSGISDRVYIHDGSGNRETVLHRDGCPREIYIFDRKCDEELYRKMIDNTAVTGERMKTDIILNIPGWRKMKSADGIWRAEESSIIGNIYIYYCIESPMVRRDFGTKSGFPNPEAFTFVDFYGEGKAELTVNRYTFDPVALTGGKATVTDIPLEKGFNYILVKWSPVSEKSTIQMKWRNIMNRPETTFIFM